MSNKEIALLTVDVDNLYRQQFEALKKHVIDTLTEAIGVVMVDDFNAAKQMTFNSPAGDDMGMDNDCIDFGFNGKEMDFREAIYALEELKGRIKNV